MRRICSAVDGGGCEEGELRNGYKCCLAPLSYMLISFIGMACLRCECNAAVRGCDWEEGRVARREVDCFTARLQRHTE